MNCPKCGAKAWKTVDDKDKFKFCYYECGSNGWISHNPDLASRSDACRIAELEAENAKLVARIEELERRLAVWEDQTIRF